MVEYNYIGRYKIRLKFVSYIAIYARLCIYRMQNNKLYTAVSGNERETENII